MMSGSRVKLEFHRYDYASYLMFFAYAACSLAVPVSLMQIATSLRFPLEDGGLGLGGALQAGRTVSMTLIMLAASFMSGKHGIRRPLGVSVLLMGTGCLLAALSRHYWPMFLAILVSGIGEGFVEAMGTPFVQKLHVENTGQYMNFAHSFWSVGVAVMTLGAGLLLMNGVSWRLVVFIPCVFSIVAAMLFLLPEKRGREYPEGQSNQDARSVARKIAAILKTPRFWLFFLMMFIAGGAEYCFTFWLASFLQLSMSAGAFLGGVATAVFAGGMMVGRMGWGVLVPQAKLGTSLLVAAVVGTALSLLVPFIQPDWPIGRHGVLGILLVLLFLIGITMAPLWPTLQTYCVDRVPKSLDETLIFVLLSCAGVPGCGAFTYIMGVLGDWLGGLDRAFFLAPFCQILLALCLIWELRQKRAE